MPIPVLSLEQMREWEKATWASGRKEAEVIRVVGEAVARRALILTRPGDRILILAGKGHNGDDARAAREHLRDRQVGLLEVLDPAADRSRCEAMLSRRPALVIDGLFGIGISRPLDEAWVNFIQRINAARCPVLAVDTPSGLNADTGESHGAAIEAAITLTVGAPKKGLLAPSAWPYVGRLEVAHGVGLCPCPHTSDLNWTLPEDFAAFPPPRPVSGHKGTFGRLAIVAGSLGYHGAAVLTSRGAQRAQPGLITLFVHEPAYHATASQLQAVMVHPWNEEIDLPGQFSAIEVGPGLAAPGVPDKLRRMVSRLWCNARVPMIVDASALDWLPPDSAAENAVRLITPHPGEAGRLLNSGAAQVQAERVKALRDVSRRLGNCWVVLKGHQTLVGRGEGPVFVNSSGNPHLAQGGAGDLLSGYLAGLLAQPSLQEDASRTIRYGVWEHGAAADSLQSCCRNWIVEDLAAELGTTSTRRHSLDSKISPETSTPDSPFKK